MRTWREWWRDWWAAFSPTPRRQLVLYMRVVDSRGGIIAGPFDAEQFALIIRYGGAGCGLGTDHWIPLWRVMGLYPHERLLMMPTHVDAGYSIQFRVEVR